VSAFEEELERRLAGIREAGLWRELRRIDSPQGARVRFAGRELVNLSSNDYLGLAAHPALIEAAAQALRDFGAGAGASRLVCGSLAPHHRLEESLAAFKGTDAALSFSSGYAAAVGTITALLDKDDVIVVDRLVHACCVDAARLSGAKLRVFAHNDLSELESILKWADQRLQGVGNGARKGRVLVVTESVFSMDGDLAPLREIVELKDRFGAWLMLDEAHALGLFGEQRRGLADAFELGDRIEIQMGTLGKALGAAGGFVAGSRRLVDLLVNRARSFIFSTAPVPAATAAAEAGIQLVAGPEGAARNQRLWALVDALKNALIRSGWPPGLVRSPIIPLVVGDEGTAVNLAAALREAGYFVPAIRFPTVARGAARLRVTVSASHQAEELSQFAAAVAASRPQVRNSALE
jgi:8-amino-7-oxononanoate synthase